MTVKVTTKNHTERTEVFETDTPEQMVGYLWKASFIHEASADQYMKAVARREAMYDGKVIRTDTAAHFLADLAKAGLIELT